MSNTTSSGWVRWCRYSVVIAIMLGVSAALFYALDSPSAADFCTGRRKCKITRLTLSGQGCRGTLSDQVSLEWFASRPGLGSLPPSSDYDDGASFRARLRDGFSDFGTIDMFIASNKRVIGLAYYESPIVDGTYSFLMLGSNLPPQLDSLFSFLLAPENRGKEWIDGTIQFLKK